MKFAIDRNVIGKEKEVAACDLYDTYVYNKHKRFSCPECGEAVHWRKRSWDGSMPDVFYHLKKTESTPECDKRVDGNSGLSLCERVGLPLYLQKDIDDVFKLYLGCYPLGQTLLQRAFENKVQMKISCGGSRIKREQSVFITPTNFYADRITHISIDFIPSNGYNYLIGYSESAVSDALRRKWSGYADGFSQLGAIFECSENGGKKIKRGASIVIEQEYFVVAQQFSPQYREISSRIVGSIILNNQKYYVYIMTVNVSENDPIKFERINNYFKTTFGVWLLVKAPELVPLWPPVIENEELVPVFSTGKLFCAAISGNEVPRVYSYTGCTSLQINIESDGYKNHTVALQFYSSEIVASVDRKYVGSEVVFKRKPLEVSTNFYKLSVKDKIGVYIDTSIPLPASLVKDGMFISLNAKAEMYQKKRDERYHHVSIRDDKPINIWDLNIHDELLIYVESKILCNMVFARNNPKMEQINEYALVIGLLSSAKGIEIPIPSWVSQLIKIFAELGYKELNNKIKKMACCGNLKMGTLKYLSDIKETIVHA